MPGFHRLARSRREGGEGAVWRSAARSTGLLRRRPVRSCCAGGDFRCKLAACRMLSRKNWGREVEDGPDAIAAQERLVADLAARGGSYHLGLAFNVLFCGYASASGPVSHPHWEANGSKAATAAAERAVACARPARVTTGTRRRLQRSCRRALGKLCWPLTPSPASGLSCPSINDHTGAHVGPPSD